MQVPTAEFLLVSLALFAAWAVTGAWRLMREELQMQASPLAWLAFAVFFMVYIAGFWHGPTPAPFLDGGSVGSPRVWSSRISRASRCSTSPRSSSQGPVVFRRLVARWRAGGAAAAFKVLPCWLATVPLLLLVGAAAAVVSERCRSAALRPARHPALFVVSCLGFVVRDIALLLAFNFGRNPKRADVAALIYWMLLYGVLPTILRQLDIRDTLFLFYPTGGGAGAIFAPAIQAAVGPAAAQTRWRRTGLRIAGRPRLSRV